jgi:hypothetical protein
MRAAATSRLLQRPHLMSSVRGRPSCHNRHNRRRPFAPGRRERERSLKRVATRARRRGHPCARKRLPAGNPLGYILPLPPQRTKRPNDKASGVAVVLVDVINGFDFEGSAGLVRAATRVAPAIQELASRAREKGVPVALESGRA